MTHTLPKQTLADIEEGLTSWTLSDLRTDILADTASDLALLVGGKIARSTHPLFLHVDLVARDVTGGPAPCLTLHASKEGPALVTAILGRIPNFTATPPAAATGIFDHLGVAPTYQWSVRSEAHSASCIPIEAEADVALLCISLAHMQILFGSASSSMEAE